MPWELQRADLLWTSFVVRPHCYKAGPEASMWVWEEWGQTPDSWGSSVWQAHHTETRPPSPAQRGITGTGLRFLSLCDVCFYCWEEHDLLSISHPNERVFCRNTNSRELQPCSIVICVNHVNLCSVLLKRFLLVKTWHLKHTVLFFKWSGLNLKTNS